MLFGGQAVENCGRRWREVAKRVPARSDKQCRERFCNVLDPDLKREDEWTADEDAALRAAIAQHTQPDGKIRCASYPPLMCHVCACTNVHVTDSPTSVNFVLWIIGLTVSLAESITRVHFVLICDDLVNGLLQTVAVASKLPFRSWEAPRRHP